MNKILRTGTFDRWLRNLKDISAKVRIARRIEKAQQGHFGDCKPVGNSIYEMRIHSGAGYRVYYTQRGAVVYLLLCAGDKSSQTRDIKQAKVIAEAIKGLPDE